MGFTSKYPYTDYHEMNLDWFLGQFKELVSDWDDFKTYMENEWENVKNDWETLYNYVHDYFDNLDVQAEIDHKLDEMLLNGDFDAPIASAAGAWLLAHLATPSTPPIDNTLSVASAAADSKTVGDLCLHGNARVVTAADPWLVDADYAEENQIYLIQDENVVSRLPADVLSKGTLWTIAYEPGHNDGRIQFYVTGESNQAFCYRLKWAGAWRNWKVTRALGIEGSGYGVVHSGQLLITDADTVQPETIYTIGEVGVVANLPIDSTELGTLMTYSFRKTTPEGGICQIFIDTRACMYHRICWGYPGVWGDWQLTSNNYQIKGSGIGHVSLSTPLISDADNAGINTIYVITEEGAVANLPSDCWSRGTLMTYNYKNINEGGCVQKYVDLVGNTFERVRWGLPGTWKPWVWLNQPIANMSMFETMAVIGDSYSSGTVYINGVSTTNKQKSWAQILARSHGIDCKNFTHAGVTCRTWQTYSDCMPLMLADTTHREIYFIALALPCTANENSFSIKSAIIAYEYITG